MAKMALIAAMLLVSAGAAPAAAGPWQCVTFARTFSGIALFGNAATWWAQATGRYDQGGVPRVGGVLVFKPAAHMRVGHVATVSEIVSPREIRVTHANWSPVDGRRGEIEENVTVVDTSAAGDWSRVRVWYAPLRDIGRTDYAVFGFIYGKASAAVETTERAIAAVAALPVDLAGS